MNAPMIETSTGCLLVVDDQESNIQVVGAALGKLGFEILPATGGLQAFQRLADILNNSPVFFPSLPLASKAYQLAL